MSIKIERRPGGTGAALDNRTFNFSKIDNTNKHNTLQVAALAYAALDWPVFRLSSSKLPLKGSHAHKDATTDAEVIRRWWGEMPEANIGLACGPLVVCDCDGPGGLDGMRKLCGGRIPETLASRTARGGHLFYRSPPGVEIRTLNERREAKGGDGLDIKGAGGYVVLPPSINRKTGYQYKWINWDGVGEPFVAELPPAVVDYALRRGKAGDATKSVAAIERVLGPKPEYLVRLDSPVLCDPCLSVLAETEWTPADKPRALSALAVIPAVSRDIWLSVGMALHATGWPDAFEIWDNWSRTSSEKYDEADQHKTWKSFHSERRGALITLGTLFKLATECGWSDKVVTVEMKAPGAESKNPDPSDDDKEIARLATLSVIDYERERIKAAERLKLRASILDRLVGSERDELDDSGKQGHALNLPEPEPWPEPVSGADLLGALAANIRRHVVMFDHAADTAALWVVHTHLLDCFGISPRLAIASPEKGCGKTTALDVVSRLVCRPLAAANASAAAIFRVVELQRPTLLIDEADTFLPENEELRGILNAGHRQGGSVIRTVGEEFEPRAFSTYSACAIALIGKLPATLADRSVSIELRRRRADEAIEPFRFDRTGHLDVLARKAARWAADNVDRIRSADPSMPAGVFNRMADNWRPLLAIADAAGGEWPARARRAVQCSLASATGDDQSARVLLLSDIRAIFEDRELDRIPSATLVAFLNSIEGRPWAEWSRGRGLSPNTLARMLAPFGIAPASVRMNDGTTPKGYLLSQFEDAFVRYLPE